MKILQAHGHCFLGANEVLEIICKSALAHLNTSPLAETALRSLCQSGNQHIATSLHHDYSGRKMTLSEELDFKCPEHGGLTSHCVWISCSQMQAAFSNSQESWRRSA